MKHDAPQVTQALLQKIRATGIDQCFIIIPSIGATDAQAWEYWSAIDIADLLADRFPDWDLPDFPEFFEAVQKYANMYYVLDCAFNTIVGEFMLDNIVGKAAQVHFSLHPANTMQFNVSLSKAVHNQLLFQWRDVRNLEDSFLRTLYGLTPVENRAACLFVLRTGMKKMGVLPSGAYYYGNVVDAMVTVKTSN